MKTFSKIIAYSLALTLSISGSAILSGNSKTSLNTVFAEEQKSGEWGYKIYDKIDGICSTPCIEITRYYGMKDIVDIPENIKGYPVVSIAGKPFSGIGKFCEILNIPSSIKRFDDGILDDSMINVLTYENDYKFSMEEDHTLKLIAYEGSQSDIEIPSSVAGYTVTTLYDHAFSENKTIRSVRLPDTINYFGLSVFRDSTLEKINIPDSLKIIPSNTFNGCNNLNDVELNDHVIVAKNAFKDAPVVLPESALSYEASSCGTSFSSIIINKDQWRFKISYDMENCSYYSEFMRYNYLNDPLISDTNKKVDLDIPEIFFDTPVTKIGDYFWRDCNNAGIALNSITFPSGINEIENLILNSPSELKSVTIKAENPIIFKDLFKGTGIEKISLHGSCVIDENAFSDCENLKKVVITGESENIKISAHSFYNCKALEKISLPDNSDIEIDNNAFRNCSSLKDFTVNGNVSVFANAFRDCENLTEISISGNVNLSTNAFLDDKALTNIFVDTNTPLEGSAFNGCSNLMNINSIPAFNSQENDLVPQLKSFVLNNFNGSEDVGFVNLYVLSQAEKVVSEYTDSDMSDIQKARILHDWICNKVTYDEEDVNNIRNQNDGSVFMNDLTVCEGYAKGYNLLLQAAGIDSVCVHSNTHAWNIIKLGSQYFHVDTTWDDGDQISYNWFLKSDSEVAAETSSHSKWSLVNLSPLHNSTDKLPECKYSMGDINTDGKTNIADMVILNRYILGNAQLNSDNYILSDLDFDGRIDSFDLVCMRKIILNSLTSNS